MSNFTPLVNLVYLDGSNPRHYGLRIVMNNSDDYSTNTESEIESHPDDENGYILVIELGEELSEDLNNQKIDLGELPLHSTDGFIDVHFENQGSLIEKKKVKTQEAQKESRPTG